MSFLFSIKKDGYSLFHVLEPYLHENTLTSKFNQVNPQWIQIELKQVVVYAQFYFLKSCENPTNSSLNYCVS